MIRYSFTRKCCLEPHPTNQNVHGGICTLNVDKKLVDRAKVHIYASQMKIFISATTCEYQTCNIVITQKDMKNQRFGRYKKLRIRRVSQDFQDVVFLMIIWVSYKNKNRTPVTSRCRAPEGIFTLSELTKKFLFDWCDKRGTQPSRRRWCWRCHHCGWYHFVGNQWGSTLLLRSYRTGYGVSCRGGHQLWWVASRHFV